jgi:hypothetical protein
MLRVMDDRSAARRVTWWIRLAEASALRLLRPDEEPWTPRRLLWKRS